MRIKQEKRVEIRCLQQNAFCSDLDSGSCCIHNDLQQKLVHITKFALEGSSYEIAREVLFCPFCGFSYNPVAT
jgi:hypothetical protein